MRRVPLHARTSCAASIKRQKPSQENSRPAIRATTIFAAPNLYKSRGETVPIQRIGTIEARGFSTPNLS